MMLLLMQLLLAGAAVLALANGCGFSYLFVGFLCVPRFFPYFLAVSGAHRFLLRTKSGCEKTL